VHVHERARSSIIEISITIHAFITLSHATDGQCVLLQEFLIMLRKVLVAGLVSDIALKSDIS